MLTRSNAPRRPRRPLQTQLERLSSDRWARRGVRVLIRATTLGLALTCIGVGLNLWLGWNIRWEWLAATVLLCIAGGALLILRPRLSPGQVARRLDRRFQLQQQLATALELDAAPEGVAAYLDDQARSSLGQIRRYIAARQRFPWPDLVLTLALCLALVGLLILAGVDPLPGRDRAEPLPALNAPPDVDAALPDEPFQPPPGTQAAPAPGGEAQGQTPGDSAAAAALADALRDQSVTRPAADALERGDTASAAQQLRELADQADAISQQARDELAAALNDAATDLQGSNPDLAQQLRESAQDLRSGDDAAAAEALEQLAEAVEDLGNPGSGQNPAEGQGEGQAPGQGGGAGEGAGGEQREQPTDRLGVDGVPLELESEGEPNTPTGNEASGTADGSANGGFSQASRSPSSERVDVADDPLRIPTDLRDVVQDYFSP